MHPLNIYLGWDSRETLAYEVARASIASRTSMPVAIRALRSDELYERRLLWRPVERSEGVMRDHLSQAPQSTEFAASRFLVPFVQREGWALFADCDIVCMADIADLFELADPRYAVMCVKHPHLSSTSVKMDGQVQTAYSRKLWSSVVLWNCSHRANQLMLDLKTVNAARGLWLHNFQWLCDDEIGELPAEWNWLVGLQDRPASPKIAHFTLGGPWLPGWKGAPHDEVWDAERDRTRRHAA